MLYESVFFTNRLFNFCKHQKPPSHPHIIEQLHCVQEVLSILQNLFFNKICGNGSLLLGLFASSTNISLSWSSLFLAVYSPGYYNFRTFPSVQASYGAYRLSHLITMLNHTLKWIETNQRLVREAAKK